MALLPFLLDELLEERERQYRPLRHVFDQNFGLGLLDSDLFENQRRPVRNRMLAEPLVCGYLRPWRLSPQQQSGISDVSLSKDGFKVNLDVQQFKPEEISVKVVDNSIIVEGKHEERQDDHGFVSRTFSRRYVLPDNVDPAAIQSSLSSDGVLQVSAPPKALPDAKERSIPITHTQQPAVKGKSDDKGSKPENMEQALLQRQRCPPYGCPSDEEIL